MAGRAGRHLRRERGGTGHLRGAGDCGAAGPAGPGNPPRCAWSPGPADTARQLRASDRRVCEDRRRHSAPLPAGPPAGHQPRAAEHRRRDQLPGAPLSLPGPGDRGPAAPGSSDAVMLFVERAKERGVDRPVDDETAPLVVSICEQLDGMPLAIELAAARLRSMSLGDLHDRLDQRFRLLTGGSRAALGRQQTLQATVDWSYSLLNGAEQTLLRRTSVFAEGFDLGAAENVCGFGNIDVLEVADLLDSLVNKSLVGAEPAGSTLRYRLLETIRQFAAERLAETGDEAAAVASAHRRHFLGVAEAAGPHPGGREPGTWVAR